MPNWTEEQLKAINSKGSNILVAAAAGSGKTAVLVERIVKKVLVDNVDIDKLLVVTFTNAAAAEMKERILERLYKEIEKNPNDSRLQKQILLLNKANISTIHSFCLEVIKNNFYEISVSPNFRIGDTLETEILKQEVLEDLFEEHYEAKDDNLTELVNIYGGYRGDEKLKEIILQIYNYIQSAPFPEKWLSEKIEMFNNNLDTDFSKTEWGKIIIENVKEELTDSINNLKIVQKDLKREKDLEKFYIIISEDINVLENILNRANTWDELFLAMDYEFSKWPIDKKVNSDLKEKAKEIRDKLKKKLKSIKEDILVSNSESVNSDIYEMYKILKKLESLIFEFNSKFHLAKKEKNIIDFNDIEHFALKILTKENEQGEIIPSEIAKRYQEKFYEIAIDEYQDSNLVQEKILTSISKNNNIFMVGDVKQSIYRFRQARPELFLEKYEHYKDVENEELNENGKIKLFKNFRSRDKILDFTNIVFTDIMSKKFGEIEYDTGEYLNVGNKYEIEADNIKNLNEKIELDIIDYETKEEDEEENEIEDKIGLEATFVANRIKELMGENYYVCNKDNTYRKLQFKDIVILLRSPGDSAESYEKAITNLNFPVYSDVSSSYFDSIEIQTTMNLLKIIDNPNNDIPLTSILRSPIGNFSDNELVEIRIGSKTGSFYEALKSFQKDGDNLNLKTKINEFFNMLNDFQEKEEYLKLDELIWYLYEKTGYYDYVSVMPNGNLKTANLKMLFEKAKDYEMASFKGLYNFINYIDRVNKASSSDKTSAKLIGENENVIRIMSIHKSKGLEFPVVFLCGTGKQFNMQDLTQNILLHQDLGLGPKYINYERKIEYNTLAKEAIKIKTRNELLAEEMRLLYVALTRSREKLIITGIDKNLNKSMQDKTNQLEIVKENLKIPEYILKKAKSYLEWLELVSIFDEKVKEILEIKTYNKKEVEVEKVEGKNNSIDISNNDKQDVINELLMWKYSLEDLTKIEGKTSVSKIAKGTKEAKTEITSKPKIIENIANLSKAEIGTIVHLVLQKLNFNEKYNEEKILELLENLEANKIISTNEKMSVNPKIILEFTNSKIYLELIKAKEIHREEPFYLNVPLKNIYKKIETEEKILVQGIIDLYYISKDNELILLDYKTDYVPNNDESYLIEKYSKQLFLYKQALEESLNRNVDKVYIYSTYLEKEILVK